MSTKAIVEGTRCSKPSTLPPIPGRGGPLPLLAVHGGDILTMDPLRPRASALLALGEHILAVGDDATIRAEYEALRGLQGVATADPIDLRGRAVVPGLIDSHLHLLWYGFFLQQVDLNGTASIGEIKTRVADGVSRSKPGAWVQGGGWQQDTLAERRMPTRHDLDEVAPDNPVVLHRVCYHAVAVNSLALRLAGITADTADPPGGVIDRDPQTGEPTGILREHATGLVAASIPEPSQADVLEALRLASRRASAAGLTSVHTNDGPGDTILAYLTLRETGELTVRAYFDTTMEPDNEAALTLPPRLGDNWVRVGAVKMFTDGSLGARTAALRAPYSDAPSTSGLPVFAPEQISMMVRKAHARHRQVAIHAIGDRALDIALDAIEGALATQPRADHRHRIVHAQIVAPDIIERMARLGVVVDIQPKFVTGELVWAPDRIGPGRLPWAYCWRRMLAAGVRCAAGSDCPVEPLEPLYGIYAAVTRSDMEGAPAEGWIPEERLDPVTALRLFTLDAAYGAFEETIKSGLEPGKLADFAVLDRGRRPRRAARDQGPQVQMTVVGGRIVHGG